jgi:predicted DNA-binding transcriptional regulator YafY
MNMVRLQSTGSPADLANRFEISVRTVKRLIREMRLEGTPLRYDFNKVSYIIDGSE